MSAHDGNPCARSVARMPERPRAGPGVPRGNVERDRPYSRPLLSASNHRPARLSAERFAARWPLERGFNIDQNMLPWNWGAIAALAGRGIKGGL